MSDTIEVKQYHPQDAIEIKGDPDLQELASLNQVSGPAYTLFDEDGKTPILCGGVRVHGVGEAWVIASDKIRAEPKLLMRTVRQQMDRVIRENSLWRMWAGSEVSDTFLEHFDFVPRTGFIWQVRARR